MKDIRHVWPASDSYATNEMKLLAPKKNSRSAILIVGALIIWYEIGAKPT